MSVPTLDVHALARRSRRSARSRAWREGASRTIRDSTRRAELALVVTTYWGEADDVTTTPVPPAPPNPHRELYERCLAGREPAEALPTKERELLVAELVTAGWTVQQIAAHTRMTLYTTDRIRARLELSPSGEAGT